MTVNQPLAWVLGAGGLLGTNLSRSLSQASWCRLWRNPVERFNWTDPDTLAGELESAVAGFARTALAHPRWMIYWTAGIGVVGTSEAALQAETATWEAFLTVVAKHLGQSEGALFLASSAGGVYGDNPEQPLTEDSHPSPISPYGKAKLRQEELLRQWASDRQTISYVVGRISNLYGPGQNLAKAQGLLSHISRCLIHNKPLHLYVPLDTIRDYIPADACADAIVVCTRYAADQMDQSGPRGVVKILASEEEASLAHILGVFSRVSHRHPKLICSPSPAGLLQPRRLQFRTSLWRHLGTPACCSLQAGINRLHQHHLSLYVQGRLPSPS